MTDEQTASPKMRVRFAPSPTGYLHVGGARTALYNWLMARKTNGTFILRIEDTDVQRSSQEMTDVILNSMQWLGLNWDEGPYYQSQRLEMYRKAANRLIEMGKAYRCFCKPEELSARREAAQKATGSWKYEGRCLQLTPGEIAVKVDSGEPFAIRFHVLPGRTSFQDQVHEGELSKDHGQIDDFVLLRSDGFPTYHLSVVVDDIDMRITDIIRGQDHIDNTFKQIMLYQAFGSPIPQFAHLPMILGADRKRLSKRHGSVAVEEYRNQGILPEALFNFLVLLGWNPGDEREVMSKEELAGEFDLRRVNSSNAIFDLKKLQWMNSKYIATLPLDEILSRLEPHLPPEKAWTADPSFKRRVDLVRTRAATLPEVAQMLIPFYKEDLDYEPAALEKVKKDPQIPGMLEEYSQALQSVDDWAHNGLEAKTRAFAEQRKVKPAVVIHPVRLGTTGRTAGPGLFEILELLGKDSTIRRLARFVQVLKAG